VGRTWKINAGHLQIGSKVYIYGTLWEVQGSDKLAEELVKDV
jgi:hypothetical protein